MNVPELKRQVEHKFAPVPLLAVQALANTYSFEDDEERLLDPPSTRRWLLDSGLARPEVEVGEEGLAELLAFRGAIRTLIGANLAATRPSEELADVERFLAAHPLRLSADRDGGLDIDLEPVGSIGELIAQMTGIVFRAQLTADWPRLKICASDECRWAFYDASRNRGGTWCQMEVCGNRIKNRRFRERAAGQ